MITAWDMLRNTLEDSRLEQGPPKKAQASQGALEFVRGME